MKKLLEEIGKKLGYKYFRYGIPYQLECKKHKNEIDYLKSVLADDLSRDVLNAAIKCRMTRNYKYLKPFYDTNNTKELMLNSGYTVCFDPSQYFPKDIIKLSTEEVFIDGGGFVGDTALNFIEQTTGYFNKVHIFEPIKRNCEQIRKNITNLSDKVILHNLGLYSSCEETFFEDSGSGSRIGKGKELVKLVALDNYFSEQERSEITYIKLDVEGAEMSALEGMQDTIIKYNPKLAICIYHKPADLWELPLYIHKLNPKYNLYIRQHHPVNETVLYAV